MDEGMFELVTKMYSEMKQNFEALNKKLDEKADKTDIVKLENQLIPEIEALFDGYRQNTEALERIEKEVSNHEEFIMKRVK